MKRNYWTHVTWLAIAIAGFVIAYRWMPSLIDGSATERSTGQAAGRHTSGSTGARYAPGESRPAANDKTKQPTKSLRREGAVTDSKDRSDPGGGGRAIPDVSTGMPLGEDQLRALVRASIRSSNPIERRRAFDRLLRETRSGSFTREQAVTIRSELAKNGASGEQWKLFDYAWGANNPATAVAYLDEIPPQELESFLGNMIPGLASTDPQAAIDLFHGLDEGVQSRIRNRFYEGLIDNDILVATKYIYDATDSSKGHDWRPMDILTREVAREAGLDSTLQWAAELPEGRLRANAWSAAYAVWGTHEPDVAVQEIIQMPPSGDRNQAINGFISALAGQDGAKAVAWAAEITHPEMRDAAMVRAGKQFYRQDQQAATEWLQSSGLPAGAWEQVTGSR